MTNTIVTPWEVSGEVNYEDLIANFGTQRISEELLDKIKKKAGALHPFLRREIFFSHRDLDWILDEYEKGNKFYLYTGRGPSGHTHIGHLIPWIFTKYLQDTFKTKLYFQMTDDEKFLFKEKLELKEAYNFSYENALDVIAMGFRKEDTFIFSDLDLIKALYPIALQVSKKVNFSTTKAVFGFKDSTNIGGIFFTAIQSTPAFFESIKQKKNVPCLIPHAIDQDPHFRITRDIAPKLGFYKPASIHSKFIPDLRGGKKMSASDPGYTIFTIDTPETVKEKINDAFTGGKETIKEQKEKGGDPTVCSVFQYLLYLFEDDDKKLSERAKNCKNGSLTCGECKSYLCGKITKFLDDHQKKREKAKNVLNDFLLDEKGLVDEVREYLFS